jgi:hypothetical protein
MENLRFQKVILKLTYLYRDKEEILRKARLLKGSNIYISEDFSRKVREHRNELIKFMKEVKSRDPTRQEQINYKIGTENKGFQLGFPTEQDFQGTTGKAQNFATGRTWKGF